MAKVKFEGKKLLILGGAAVHCKIVTTAKKMGIYTIVTDYLDKNNSPAKQLSDESWQIDLYDVDRIVEKCRNEKVNGVICGWLDPAQRPYAQICKKLGLPCYGTEDQFFKLTDKHAFKKLCFENGLRIITEFSENDIRNNTISFPVFVKPVDSRGSRGQSVCNSMEEIEDAISLAKSESSNGDILIEEYINNLISFQVTYFVVNDVPYLIRTADGYKGNAEDKLDKVALCSISPSKYTNEFIAKADAKMRALIKKMEIHNGPFMAQGFYENGDFVFYDPGLRFPGVDYDLIYQSVTGYNVMEQLIIFSLTGFMNNAGLYDENVFLNGKFSAVFFPTIQAGKIRKITGGKRISRQKYVYSCNLRYKEGDTVKWTYNVNQRIAEIDILGNSLIDVAKKIEAVKKMLVVMDDNGCNMISCPFSSSKIYIGE